MANLLFSHDKLLHERFVKSDLGQLYVAIPFDELAKQIPAPKHALSGKGCKPWLDLKGAIGLLILKHYTNLSDETCVLDKNYEGTLNWNYLNEPKISLPFVSKYKYLGIYIKSFTY